MFKRYTLEAIQVHCPKKNGWSVFKIDRLTGKRKEYFTNLEEGVARDIVKSQRS